MSEKPSCPHMVCKEPHTSHASFFPISCFLGKSLHSTDHKLNLFIYFILLMYVLDVSSSPMKAGTFVFCKFHYRRALNSDDRVEIQWLFLEWMNGWTNKWCPQTRQEGRLSLEPKDSLVGELLSSLGFSCHLHFQSSFQLTQHWRSCVHAQGESVKPSYWEPMTSRGSRGSRPRKSEVWISFGNSPNRNHLGGSAGGKGHPSWMPP